jgi:hypothetical protein
MPGGQQPPLLGATLSRGYDPMSEADWPSAHGEGAAEVDLGLGVQSTLAHPWCRWNAPC